MNLDLRPEEIRAEDGGRTRSRSRRTQARLREVPWLGLALQVQDRYVDDRADQHAAAIGFFGFVSLFPLLLLALSIAGFVLSGDVQAQHDFADTLVDAIPGFRGAFGEGGTAVQDAVRGLAQNAGQVGVLGLASLLFTGLKVVNSANHATLAVFHVDVEVGGALLRLRQVGVLFGLGALALLGVAATGLVGAAAAIATDEAAAAVGNGRPAVDGALQLITTIVGLAGSFVADFALFVAAYKLLSFGRGPAFVHVWPGAVLAAVGWTGLKAFGATYITGQIARTDAAIGALGGVVGLLLLLYLAGRVYVYGAEFTALVRNPGLDLDDRHDEVRYEGEDLLVLGSRVLARKQALARRLGMGSSPQEPAATPEDEHAERRPVAWAGGLQPSGTQPALVGARDLDRDAEVRVAVTAGLAAGALLALAATARARRFPW